jgi:hypothetical protein
MIKEDGAKWFWTKWFAWYPVIDNDGCIHWLRYVKRRYVWVFTTFNPEDAKIVWEYQKL